MYRCINWWMGLLGATRLCNGITNLRDDDVLLRTVAVLCGGMGACCAGIATQWRNHPRTRDRTGSRPGRVEGGHEGSVRSIPTSIRQVAPRSDRGASRDSQIVCSQSVPCGTGSALPPEVDSTDGDNDACSRQCDPLYSSADRPFIQMI